MKKRYMFLIGMVFLIVAGCGDNEDATADTGDKDEGLTPVSFVLEWTPNTNHTGIYVAQEKGFFAEEGLDVEVLLPGEVRSEQLITTGKADFGISVQERMTIARSEGLPIVSVAAIIQHNTAGFASPVEHNITEPKDFEGKVYGGVGSDLEKAMMQTIMEENDADFQQIEYKNIGDADYFTAVEREIDFSLVYQGWTGIEAELREQELNMVYLKDFSDALDFYTPVLATSEAMIEDDPDMVTSFVKAAVKGYEYAMEHPTEAADILTESEPDLDEELVKRSQAWLSRKYQDDAAQFGVQEEERWEKAKEFMVEHNIIEADINIEDAFTNDFLPND